MFSAVPEGVQAVVAAGPPHELVWLPAEHITKISLSCSLEKKPWLDHSNAVQKIKHS